MSSLRNRPEGSGGEASKSSTLPSLVKILAVKNSLFGKSQEEMGYRGEGIAG